MTIRKVLYTLAIMIFWFFLTQLGVYLMTIPFILSTLAGVLIVGGMFIVAPTLIWYVWRGEPNLC